MPLSSLGESGQCELYANHVYFFMTYGGHRIRCGIKAVNSFLAARNHREEAMPRLQALGHSVRLMPPAG
jgi:hypothetical protein